MVLQSCALHVTGVAPQDIVRDAANAIHEDATAGEADVVVPQVCSDPLQDLNADLAVADCAPCRADCHPYQHERQSFRGCCGIADHSHAHKPCKPDWVMLLVEGIQSILVLEQSTAHLKRWTSILMLQLMAFICLYMLVLSVQHTMLET